MAFTLKICLSNPCTSTGGRLNYKDISGQYDVDDNPTGYGAPGGPTSPSDFTGYNLSLWHPGTATTGDPDITINLIPGIPTVDADGYYTWSLGPVDLGLTVIQSGVWWGLATGMFGDTTYQANTAGLFSEALGEAIDTMMKRVDITCGCNAGCEDPIEIYAKYLATICGGQASGPQFQANVDWLTFHTPLCC